MEMQLDSLIEKIKTEGITEAKKSSEQILSQAQEKKEVVVKDAQQRAGLIIKEAEETAAKLKDNADKAIGQAVRDAALSLKEEIKNVFDAILKNEIQNALSDDFIKELILKIAEAWSKDKDANLDVLLNPQDKDRLENLMLSKLKAKLGSGITFKVNPNVNKGLYVGVKDSDVYYDFTDEAILEILKEYLRPFIVKILEGKEEK